MKKLLGILLILALIIPTGTTLASPEGSVVDTIGLDSVTLQDLEGYYLIDNGQFKVEIYKAMAGYNKIYYPDYSVAVYNARMNLEYLSGNKWKQIGIPMGISYTEYENGYIVTRHYDNYLGTTYDVEYLFLPDQPIKITIKVHSGQTDNYRLVWSLSGITRSDYIEKPNQLDFEDIAFDWTDVHQFTSSYNITTAAQGKKAEITFDLGSIQVGQEVVVDPSVVGTTTTNAAAGVVFQRRTFYAVGRHWVFYTDGTNNGFRSSTTGTGSWSAFTSVGAGGHQALSGLSIFYDGTYVHYMRVDTSDHDVYYRRGAPQSDGSITWSAAEQKAFTSAGDVYYGSICVNSGGYPFITYYDVSVARPKVTKSSTNDGNWSTQAAFPFQLTDSNFMGILVVPLTANDVYVIYARGSSNDIQGRLWDDSITTWAAEEDVTSNEPESNMAISATAYNGTIYFAYLEHNENVKYVEYSGGSWGADTLVYDGTDTAAYPAISLWSTGGDLRVFWIGNEDEHLYYIERTGGDWDADPTDWIDETTDTICSANFTSYYEKQSGFVGVVYLTQVASPRDVEYAFLMDVAAPTVTNSAADDITKTTATLHGEITSTGGVNATNRGFEWDTDSGAPYANDWDEVGDFGTGVFEHGINSLPPDTTIYWRAYATNSEGTGYSSELNFDTLLPLPLAPTNFTIEQTAIDTITLTWTKGTYADTTVIRASVDSPPSSLTDGYEVYNDTGTTTDVTGINSSEINGYGFSAWSHNTQGYSEDYAHGTIGGEGMLAVAVAMIIMGLTALAFIRKEGMLYAVGIIAWMFFTLFMFNQNWPPENTYLPTAIAFIGASMVIVFTIMLLNHYIISRRYIPPTHAEIQLAHRKKVLSITRRKKKEPWYL